jgi:hypothetical protein
VGVIERGEELRFTLKPREAVRIGGEQIRQHLDRDVTTEFGVMSEIDLTHAASPKSGPNLVRADLRAGS